VPESIIIVGSKRSGKTSLLNYLNKITQVNYLRPEQPKAWPPRHFQFALVDFQDINMSQPESLVKEVLQQLKLEVPSACSLAVFSNLVKRQLSQPAVILMDNIGLAALETAFWRNMCSLGNCGKLSFVVTSLEPPEKLEHDKAFFSLFGHSLHLDALTENEARELLAHSPFSPEEIEWMLKESGCWPAPLQMLCDRRLQQLLLK